MTADIVLWLDLAEANQQDDANLRESVPAGAEILRLTEQGVEPCPGGTPTRWRPVLDGIDRLVRRARKHEEQASCRYWVTGRAGLPAFFYLGHRLGKLAAITFVHQARNGGPAAILPLDLELPGQAAPYLARTPSPISPTESAAPVALAVSSQNLIANSLIEDAFERLPKRLATIIHGHAEARFERDAVPVVVHELDELIREICAAHPMRETLAVFIAGPSSLAFLVGNAIAPRACRNVQVFQYEGDRYTLAYELPHPPVPARNVALWLGASPLGTTQLALAEEIRQIQSALGDIKPGDRLTIASIPNARPLDLVHQLQAREPGIIQFSGHGGTDGPVFQDDHGEARPLPAADLAELLRLGGDPVRIVVIAACSSNAYAEALRPHVDCVIAMRGLVGDTDARAFATELYRRLAMGDSVQAAFDNAKLVMRLARPASGPTLSSADEAPQLRERDLGCASNLFLVRRP